MLQIKVCAPNLKFGYENHFQEDTFIWPQNLTLEFESPKFLIAQHQIVFQVSSFGQWLILSFCALRLELHSGTNLKLNEKKLG